MKIRTKLAGWFKPYFSPKRFKGLKGGRGSAKSHHFAQALVLKHIQSPDINSVCIREIQKSLKFSAKKLIEEKIRVMGVSHLFDITLNEIRSINGDGVMIFQGMQDHTADSIKSLEGFDIAWIEEAQTISKHSIELLVPTIRKSGSELWFSWNPRFEDDPVEQLFKDYEDSCILTHVNYTDNPFCPGELKEEAERHRIKRPDTFDHVWLGGYSVISESQIFKDKFKIEEFTPDASFGNPYYGLDFGFSVDPTAATKSYVADNKLYIHEEAGKVGLELDDTAQFIKDRITGIEKYVIRADSARPESISYLKRTGLPRIEGVEKGKGSVEDGIEFIKSFDEIIIHPQCVETAKEFRLYSYKTDKSTGDIIPVIMDKHNHYCDALRYSLHPLMKARKNSTAPSFFR